eukprot:7530763-Pyramimonas_sp.AAC.1
MSPICVHRRAMLTAPSFKPQRGGELAAMIAIRIVRSLQQTGTGKTARTVIIGRRNIDVQVIVCVLTYPAFVSNGPDRIDVKTRRPGLCVRSKKASAVLKFPSHNCTNY